MPDKFLILGANSFSGRNFADFVRAKGAQVRGLSKPGFNILDPGGWLNWVEEGEIVVNFISQSSVVESWDNPGLWLKVNAEALTDVLDRLRKTEIGKFVHVSTPEVYGSTPWWVEEDYPFHPTTPYAVSRAAGDMMLKAYFKAYGFPMLITRTANIYGPGQQPHRIIPKALQHKREDKKLPLHGGGWSKRSFIHIKDACEATYLLCKEGLIGQTYHISTQDEHWIREVVEMIGCEYEEVEDRLGKDAYYRLNSDKLRRMGWTDKISLEEGLRELQT